MHGHCIFMHEIVMPRFFMHETFRVGYWEIHERFMWFHVMECLSTPTCATLNDFNVFVIWILCYFDGIISGCSFNNSRICFPSMNAKHIFKMQIDVVPVNFNRTHSHLERTQSVWHMWEDLNEEAVVWVISDWNLLFLMSLTILIPIIIRCSFIWWFLFIFVRQCDNFRHMSSLQTCTPTFGSKFNCVH